MSRKNWGRNPFGVRPTSLFGRNFYTDGGLRSTSDLTNFQDSKLKGLILEDDKKRWKRIAEGMGTSEAGTRKRAKELNLAV
jgi:hypothetical protein